MDRADLVHALLTFQTSYQEENGYVKRFLELLEHPRCFHRDHLPGHLTGSSWILNSTQDHVVLVHHAKLNKWLQPGGHADGDENLLRVALKEAQEETGLTRLQLFNNSFFDIDIHVIPAGKSFPDHEHFDVRFLFMADDKEALQISDESNDLQWIALKDLEKFNAEQSVVRMKHKTILS